MSIKSKFKKLRAIRLRVRKPTTARRFAGQLFIGGMLANQVVAWTVSGPNHTGQRVAGFGLFLLLSLPWAGVLMSDTRRAKRRMEDARIRLIVAETMLEMHDPKALERLKTLREVRERFGKL